MTDLSSNIPTQHGAEFGDAPSASRSVESLEATSPERGRSFLGRIATEAWPDFRVIRVVNILACVFTSVVMAIPFVAHATDGVAEINHVCAVQTGCFAGDTAGYPVTVDGQAGGSYRLTSNLIVPDENTTGILISTTDVGFDLNHFAIIRSGCEGATVDCTPGSGAGSGIRITNANNRGISVKNGSITGMGSSGVILGSQGQVTGMRVRWNRLDGISVGAGSIASGNTAYENGDDGIGTGLGATVAGNSVYQNGGDGITAGSGATIAGNTAYQNGGRGINASGAGTISGNTAYNNTGDGIFGGFGATVSENTAYSNGGDGIETSGGATVQRNTVRANDGYGLWLGTTTAYRENVITSNGMGSVLFGVNMFSNSCDGTTTCP